MSNLIRGEFYKLKKSKCFIGMTILWGLFTMVCYYCLLKEAHRSNNCGLSGAVEFLTLQIYSNFLYAVFAGVFIANDFSNNTINKSFTYGYSRSEVILSKLIVYLLYSLSMELIAGIIVGSMFSTLYGFNNITGINIQLYLVKIIFIVIFCSIATLLTTAAISVISKSGIITLVSAAGIFVTIIFSQDIDGLRKTIFYVIPCLSILNARVPYAETMSIIATIVSSIVITCLSIFVIIKHLNKLDIK